MDERCTITLNFPVQVKSITSDCLSQTVTTSGQYMTSTSPKNYTFTCELEEGYKISGIDFTDGTGGYNSLSGFTDNTFTISISGASGISSTVGINVSEVQKVQKSISLDNLARFKAKCDQTYAKVGEGGGITQSTVIERPESLPTATADSPDFVQTPDGTLYRKKATEGGSLLGTWMFNDNVDCSVGYTFNISFTCSYFPSTDFTSLIVSAGPRFGPWNIFYDSGTSQNAYDGLTETTGNWVNEACKTIQITDISALTNEAEFTSWLTANATKQGGGASVSYEYVAQQDAGASGGGGTKLYEHYFNISSALGESGQLITGADKCTLSYIRVISTTPDEYATFNDFYDDILYNRIIHMENSSVNATIQWYVQSGDREHDNDWISTYAYLYVFYRTGITTFRLNPTAGPNAISSDTVTPL